MGSFCKTQNCPASERLLAFQNRGTGPGEASDISRHLRSCDFCAAELELYRFNEPVEERVYPAGKIPPPLADLATSLLNKRTDLSSLYRMMIDD